MASVAEMQLTEFGNIYQSYQENDIIAKQLLQTQHYYLNKLIFDPLTSEPLHQRMSFWLKHRNITIESEQIEDRFTHLLDHCIDAINAILILPRQTIIRVHELVPIYIAQRLDNRSVLWLNRKPGENIREKLAADPKILATTRKMSLDTPENRLFKAMLKRLEGLLLLRQEAGFSLTEKQEGLLSSIQRNLLTDEFTEIKPWQQMPPNNVLLQDKQYRKVWRSWQLAQNLELDCERQQKQFVALGFTLFGELLSQISELSNFLILDQKWDFHLEQLFAKCANLAQSEALILNVEVIDIGIDKQKQQIPIKPEAIINLILTENGHIEIHIVPKNDTKQIWHINFNHLKGVNYLNVIPPNKQSFLLKTKLPILPIDYSSFVTQFLNVIFINTTEQNIPFQEEVAEFNGNFISIIFDGTNCKVLVDKETKKNKVNSLFFDREGLDCRYTSAIDLESDSGVLSIKELTLTTKNDNNRQISAFVSELSNKIKPKLMMHYLVCDHHSDFETYELRREMNRHFKNANPLPKSIAAVFSASNTIQFKRNDLIMVIDTDDEGTYATPVYYCWGENPGDEYFERHPSIKLGQYGERYLLKKVLKELGIPEKIAERYIKLYGFSEFANKENKIAIKTGQDWYQLPPQIKLSSIDISAELIKNTVQLQKKIEKVYFISLSPAVKQQKLINPQNWLSADLLLGSQKLIEAQSIAPQKTFWRDHLPQLMSRLPLNGIEQNFYFVNSQTSIKPERGVSQPIPIEQTFKLPSDKDELRFTIYQGINNNRQTFLLSLALKHPLKSECECKLELTYTYGEEVPYQLRFKPLSDSNKPFNYVDAQWGAIDEKSMIRTFSMPSYPSRLTFEELKSFAGKKDNTDIIEWLERNFEYLNELYDFFKYGKNKKRITFAYEDINWIIGKDFGFYNHPEFKDILVHKANFSDFDTNIEKYFSADVKIKANEKKSIVNVELRGQLSKSDNEYLSNMSKRWRFPMITFSDQSRSFNDPDISKEFANKGKKAIFQAEELLQMIKGVSIPLERELKQFLCYCHSLLPQSIVTELLDSVNDKMGIRTEKNYFAYALGNIEKDWQKQLLEHLLSPVDDSGGTRGVTLEVISIAMWRSKIAINQLTAEQIISLTNRLVEHLLFEINSLSPGDKDIKWNTFIQRLELILALLRTRESDIPEIKAIFSFDSILNVKLLNLVEEITNKQGLNLYTKLNQPKIQSRVKLSVVIPDAYFRTPDLLYALKLYLSGDDGADQIMITELVNNE